MQAGTGDQVEAQQASPARLATAPCCWCGESIQLIDENTGLGMGCRPGAVPAMRCLHAVGCEHRTHLACHQAAWVRLNADYSMPRSYSACKLICPCHYMDALTPEVHTSDEESSPVPLPATYTVHATELTDSDATEHAAESYRDATERSLQRYTAYTPAMLQSAPPPVLRYFDAEVDLIQYWARSRPVARIVMATVAERRACRALRATWALHCMAVLGHHNLASCRGCGHYPTYRTCVECHIKWCGACHTWSQKCWKCYRPRHELHDCGEVLPGREGPGGNGQFE